MQSRVGNVSSCFHETSGMPCCPRQPKQQTTRHEHHKRAPSRDHQTLKPHSSILAIAIVLLSGHVHAAPQPAASQPTTPQFIVVNISSSAKVSVFERVSQEFSTASPGRVRVGVGAIFSYLGESPARVEAELRKFLELAEKFNTPILVQLDGEQWWQERPDLWNWWDPQRPGYNPGNRQNVEWSGWGPEHALRIAWRNWGRQIRVLPPPNLMSARYREVCHQEMQRLIPVVLDWWRKLPDTRRDLLIGLKLGWESSIGVNAFHYPGGNALLDRPASEDPSSGLKANELPARGVAQIGYAAVKTAGLRSDGVITEADLAEIARRHLEDLCRVAAKLGVPRDRLFTHTAGWKEGELLYQSAVNGFSSPGWSFYQHASDPEKDAGVQSALRRCDAPYWAAVEWLYQGPRQTGPWRKALAATLAVPRCRYLCIYNWEGIRDASEVLQAIREVTQTTKAP